MIKGYEGCQGQKTLSPPIKKTYPPFTLIKKTCRQIDENFRRLESVEKSIMGSTDLLTRYFNPQFKKNNWQDQIHFELII